MRMSADTGGAKIELLNSNNPMMPAGSYLLLRPDDDAMLLVNPEKKTYSEFDLAALSQAMSGLMGGGGGDAPRPEFSEPVVEKLVEEAGEPILGRPTKHFRYHLKWSMTMTMAPGMAMIIENDSIEDSWVTTDLKLDPKIARNFENMGAGMALPKDLEKVVAAQKEVMQGGLPLKRVVKGTTRTTGTGLMAAMASRMAGNQGPTTTTFEVVELSEEKIPAAVFAIPAGYTETEMMSPAMKMPDMNRQH
jgi:hypothetical protein